MHLHPVRADSSTAGTTLLQLLKHAFPVPHLLYPTSVGVDISDSSIKWLALDAQPEHQHVISWGEKPLDAGIVSGGAVQDSKALILALLEVKKQLGGIQCVHASLPEESAYIFGMHIPEGSRRKTVLNMIEFELEGRVPIPPSEAVYDYDVIIRYPDGSPEEIGVVVFPKHFVEEYVAAFDGAGLTLLSLEVEARSIARAVSPAKNDTAVRLLADFGRARTGFAVLKRGVPIFSSTVPVGGNTMSQALTEKMSLSAEDAEKLKNDEGLRATGKEKSPVFEVLMGTAGALADEVARHYRYWDTRRNDAGERVTPVEEIILVGGSSNLKGLSDYIAARVQAPAKQPNVWQNVCSFDEFVPPIDQRVSLQYATAVGLALRGVQYV